MMAKPVKIKLRLFWCAVLALCAGCATEPQRSENAGSDTAVELGFNNALFPDCKFSPLQTGVWDQCLVGEEADCVFILSPLVLISEQRSGVITLGLFECVLNYNYGLTFSAEQVVDFNCGILCGLITGVQCDNYGAQIGIMNVNDMGNRIQLCGVNVAERLRAGLINFDESRKGLSSWLDIGLFNVGASTYLQIGVLNYNYNAPIPWMVLFNCSFGERRKATPQREDGDDEPDRVFVAPASREKQATDR